MNDKLVHTGEKTRHRLFRAVPSGINKVLVVIAAVLLVWTFLVPDLNLQSNLSENQTDRSLVISASEAAPAKIAIPAIGVSAPVGIVDIDQNRELGVPKDFDEVGWYRRSAIPGQPGPSIMTGHLVSYTGTAVFYELSRLKPGDGIEVSKSDGTTAVFKVEYTEEFSQDAFPWEKIYSSADTPVLRLITCSGSYRPAVDRYSHNLVVYASLVSSSQ